MRTGSEELHDALERGQRTYDLQVRLGGRDVTEEVAEWSIDRGIDTGLPAEVAVPTGSTAAAASLTLVGDDETTAAARYSPWASRRTADVARPGQSCVVEWGLAEERMQTLRGRTTDISVQSRSGQAEVGALDGAELLRGRAWLPPVVQSAGGGPLTHTQWVVDHALRESGIYCSPPARENSIFFASMNGSREANYGIMQRHTSTVGYHPSVSPWAAGPTRILGGQPSRSWWTATYAPQRRVMSQGNQLLVEWWVYCPEPGDGPESYVEMVFASHPRGMAGRESFSITCAYDPETRELSTQINNSTVTWDAPASADQQGRFKVAFLIGLSSTNSNITARGWLYQPDGTLYPSPSWNGPSPVWGVLETVQVAGRGPVECVGISRVSGAVNVVENWRRGAALDLIYSSGSSAGASRYGLYALPEVSGTWWDLLKEISNDTLSYMWFDEDGLFHMRRYEYVTPGSDPEPDLTVTAARELSDIDASEEIRSVANRVEVGRTEYSSRSSIYTERHTYSNIVEVDPNSEQTFRVAYPERPWHLTAPQLFRGSPVPPEDPTGSVIKFLAADNTIPSVETELRFESGLPTFHFYNRSSKGARGVMAVGGNEPSFFTAYRVAEESTGSPLTRLNSASIERYGSHSLEIGASPWVQNAAWADQIALRLIEWTAWPLPTSSTVEVLPDPRIQVGDVVRIVDPTGTNINGVYRILGYTVTGSGASVTQTLDARPLVRPGPPQDAGLETEPILDPGVDSIPG